MTGQAIKAPAPAASRRPQTGRLIAPSARPAVYAVLAVAVAVTAALGSWLAGRTTLTAFDLRWDARLGRLFRTHPAAALRLADLGGPLAAGVGCVAVAVAALVLRRPRGVALAAIAAPVAAGLTDWVLKPLVDRAPFGTYTYPSGHSAAAFALATVIVLLVLDETSRRPPRVVRVAVAVVVLAVTGLVPLGLVAARYHFTTDTIGGCCVGIATALVAARVIDVVADRRASRARR
ncbi:MAG: hypothetical protein QOE97_744 [Pseudonocardiales bacterium]|nr:hypothetical protein [Pseudonocardiales bacterium]